MPRQINKLPEVTEIGQVDLNEWYPIYIACMRYSLDEGKHSSFIQSLTARINIRLPYQQLSGPLFRFPLPESTNLASVGPVTASPHVSLRMYVRHLVATGYDTPRILTAFFGDHWKVGIG
ncbi:uncharacterized protein BDW43DRAFT_287791 [Aspergillus alliaceus]|uniref:uncharacterized protein n=1 Tax=Petromyces alliaceus TaxID=209559 RepID=UPI0012A41E63|nr:uncharacterized protein BDW43DRAFT_287791 [Aspergillus alliaceus]KAB8229683.1 hypothetical protein BDW43DRAFT_287791 [Aspergillus alliaceus]